MLPERCGDSTPWAATHLGARPRLCVQLHPAAGQLGVSASFHGALLGNQKLGYRASRAVRLMAGPLTMRVLLYIMLSEVKSKHRFS